MTKIVDDANVDNDLIVNDAVLHINIVDVDVDVDIDNNIDLVVFCVGVYLVVHEDVGAKSSFSKPPYPPKYEICLQE